MITVIDITILFIWSEGVTVEGSLKTFQSLGGGGGQEENISSKENSTDAVVTS